jgi:hypothetical protein
MEMDMAKMYLEERRWELEVQARVAAIEACCLDMNVGECSAFDADHSIYRRLQTRLGRIKSGLGWEYAVKREKCVLTVKRIL